MKIPGSVVTVCTLLSCVVFAFGSSAKQLASKNRPTINTSKWNEISLPFRPFNVTAIDGSMWVCGTNEMIAVSHDAGATWQIRHQKQNGEVLLNIVFVDSMVGHAAGSGGLLLSTTDGGQTWSSHVAGSTIKQFSFSSPSEGIADVNGVVKLTSDGGDHWQEVEAIHLAIALHQPQGEDIFLSTVDSGKTWTPTHINNTFAGALFVHDREYWAFGIEYLGRENNPGGGYSVPVTLHSQDALSWQHGVRETNESSGCTRQGCFLPYGVVEGLYGNEEKIWSLP